MWGWITPVERSVTQAAEKSRWLEEDIDAARRDGFLPAPIPTHDSVSIEARAERLGWAYVIEGSMLGGRVLLKRLNETLAPWPLRYLRGYEDDGPRRWRE